MRWYQKLSFVLVFAMICSIVLQNVGIMQPATTMAAEQENSMKLNGFERLDGWTADPGVTAVLADNLKTEGLKSVRVTFDQATKEGRWVFFKQGDIAPSMDLSTVRGLYVDIYPTSETEGAQEPLAFNARDIDGNIVYEAYMNKLVPNQWNTVFIDLSPKAWLPGDNKKIRQIGFLIDMETPKLEGRTSVTYYIDNMRIATPSAPVITASQESGSVAKGTAVSLASTTGGAIYYTTDGSNPITSDTRQLYTQPLSINEDTTLTSYVHKEGTEDSFLHVFRYAAYNPAAVESYMKLEGFENLADWTSDNGVTANLTNELKSDGAYSAEVNFDTVTAGGQWIFFKEEGISPTLDLSTANGLVVDVYPTSQTQGGQEPLIAGVYAESSNYEQGMVYEGHVQKLIANQWNTVYISLKNVNFPGDRSKINRIGFLIDKNSNTFEGRTGVKYYIDNLRVAVPSIPVISPSRDSGTIGKGTPVSLTTGVAGGKIYYTTDGSNPVISEMKQEYTGPIVIDGDKTITAYVAKEGQPDSFLHIFRYKAVEPVYAKLTSQKPGNIFSSDENCSIQLTLGDSTGQSRNLKAAYNVKDYMGRTLYTGSAQDVSLEAGSEAKIDLNMPIQKMGAFDLAVSITSEDGSIDVHTATSFSRVLPAIPAAQREDSIFGACTHFGLGRGDLNKNLPIASLGGLFNVRDEMMWGLAETTQGTITIDPAWDNYVNSCITNGLEPLVIIDYGNSFYDEGGIPYTQEGIQAYVNFATTLVNHFKSKVKHWEIWNEPNMYGNPSFNPTNRTPEEYAEVLKAVYPAIKAADPEAKVIGAAVAGADFNWLERFLSVEGVTDAMDALSIHPYSYPISPEAGMLLENMKLTEDMIKEHHNGEELPLWITEIGWPTHQGEKGVSELESANYAVRSNVLALTNHNIEKLFWYDLQNDGSNVAYNEDNFGLIRYWNDKESPWGAKLGLVAYNAMSHMLTGAKYVAQAKPDDNLYLYKFHRDAENTDVVVAWNTFSTKTIGLNVPNGTYKVTDLFGNSSNYTVDNGVLTVSVSDSPVYIEGTNISQLTVAAPGYSLENKKVDALAGGTATLKINRTEAVSSKAGKVQVQLPDGWELVGDSSFEAGSGPIVLTIRVPDATPLNVYDIGLSVLSGDESTLADLAAQVNVTNPVKISMVPKPILPVADGKWSLEVTLTNLLTADSIAGTVTILEPVELADGKSVPTGTISPLGTKTISIPVGATEDKLYNVKIRIALDNGYTLETERKTSFLAAAKSQSPVTVDGSISEAEWAGSSQFKLDSTDQVKEMPDWGGIADLSGAGRIKWDSNNLYIAFSALDDTHFQQDKGSSIWKGDGIQFTIDTSRINGAGSAGYHEIGVALSTAGVQKYRWTATNGKTPGDFNEMQCSIVRHEDTNQTDYEIAVPWNQLLPEGVTPTDGDLIGFSLLLNENDTGSRNGWMEYMSGIGYAKDAGMFGDLILAPAAANGNDNNNNGNGNTGSGNSDSANLPGQVTTSESVTKLVLDTAKTEAAIKNSTSNTLTLDLNKVGTTKEKSVEIPLAVLDMAKENKKDLVIKSGVATLILSKELLDLMDAKNSITVTIKDTGKADASQYAVLSNSVDISIKSGETNIGLDKPVNVQINVSGIKDPRKAGVYYFNEKTQEWEYVGGKADKEGKTISFEAKHFSTYAAFENTKTFNDIKNSWAKDAIEVLASRHILEGDGKSFAPDKNVTRAEFAAMMVKLLDLKTESYGGRFQDVKKDAWYADALETAFKAGIMLGDGKNIRPESPITREEMATVAMKAYGRLTAYTMEKYNKTEFADDELMSSWAKLGVGNAKKLGIISGTGNNLFKPKDYTTREEAAAIIYKMLQVSDTF